MAVPARPAWGVRRKQQRLYVNEAKLLNSSVFELCHTKTKYDVVPRCILVAHSTRDATAVIGMLSVNFGMLFMVKDERRVACCFLRPCLRYTRT